MPKTAKKQFLLTFVMLQDHKHHEGNTSQADKNKVLPYDTQTWIGVISLKVL